MNRLNRFYVVIVKNLQLHLILFKNPFHLLFKLPKIYEFVVIVISFIVHSVLTRFNNLNNISFEDRATKLIAKIRQRVIIVRDANRIHHFLPNGTCSCQDHF